MTPISTLLEQCLTDTSIGHLPAFIGVLATVQARAQLRLTHKEPESSRQEDRLLAVAEASDKLGMPQDYATARGWYEKAAAQGYAPAQTNLGVLYHNGQGVPQDYVQAYMWWSVAAGHSTGNDQKLAADDREAVARRMTPAQIAEGQRLATQCKAQQFKGC
jgi:TPR repeat protein